MSDYPEDVMKEAAQIVRARLNASQIIDVEAYVEIIARAIMAERERCAKIAESHQLEEDFTLKAAQIAAAIRGDGQ